MKVVFFGSVDFSKKLFRTLKKTPGIELCGVVTRNASSMNADFCSLAPIAQKEGIDFYLDDEKNNDKLIQWLKQKSPDLGFCCGWSFLLDKSILNIPKLGMIGYHPSELPKNRGRHPIIWALAMGLPCTGSTFFFMNEEADAGKIINQKRVRITKEDDAGTLYRKLIRIAKRQISEIARQAVKGRLSGVSQNDKESNAWRKRSAADGQIDWRMSSKAIFNLVRALTHPYPGATIIYRNQAVPIWKVKPAANYEKHIEPGKVLDVKGKTVTVKCYDGAIKLIQHEINVLPKIGDYL